MTDPRASSATPFSLQDIAEHACDHLGCEGALVTQVRDARQHILASAGKALPEEFRQETPLSLSICQHTIAMNFPLAIEDTIYHPLLRDNEAFTRLGIAAYLGAPIEAEDDRAKAAICAYATRRRRWTEEDIAFMLTCADKARAMVEPVA